MRRLHYKLSAAMLVIVLLLGAAFYAVDRYSVRLYYEELSQRLNESLAMYVANAMPLINSGEVDRDALEALANRAMVINPTAEIYLLSALGRRDAWPAQDIALMVAVEDVKKLPQRPSAADMVSLAEPWRPYRAFAARLLWHHYRHVKNRQVPV